MSLSAYFFSNKELLILGKSSFFLALYNPKISENLASQFSISQVEISNDNNFI
ncbi:MAG: hypothetical protein LBC61_04725 [Candidatus Peribacteria bacterium]|nr:hypothetical protein [Candidatus Peribacteria bacterium]